MEIKYYKYGLRPIIEEKEEKFSTFYAFQWETGEFKEDMTYYRKIFNDFSGDTEEFTKEEFDAYVKQLREDRGFEVED